MIPVHQVPICNIVADGDVQPRGRVSTHVVMGYGEAMLAGDEFPPLDVFEAAADELYLADGFHRLEAAKALDRQQIAARVHEGGKREAILFSCGANTTHGQLRSTRDKRRAVLKVLGDRRWSRWSDRKIAKACRVSHPFVAAVRGDLEGGNVSTSGTERRTDGQKSSPGPRNVTPPPAGHERERWTLVQLHEDVDSLFERVADSGLAPADLVGHLNPEREERLHERVACCLEWLEGLADLLEARSIERARAGRRTTEET